MHRASIVLDLQHGRLCSIVRAGQSCHSVASTSAAAPLLQHSILVRRNLRCSYSSTSGASSSHKASPGGHKAPDDWRPPHIGFPYSNELELDGRIVDGRTVSELLAPFILEDRVARIDSVVKGRTFNVIPIVENIYDMGNLAAVCRSADAMGFGAVHVINNRGDKNYKQSNRSSAGADKWLDVGVWPNSTTECLTAMKAAGYQVIVTHLSKSSITIQEVDWTKPTAFVLGNEKEGVSEEAVALADHCAVIPMSGFVESFNISVAAALVMYEAQQQRVRKLGCNGDLTDEQQQVLRGVLAMRTVKEPSSLIKQLLDRPPPEWQATKFKKFS